MTGSRTLDIGSAAGESCRKKVAEAIRQMRTAPERLVVAMLAIGPGIAEAAKVFAANDRGRMDRLPQYAVLAALTTARCAGRKPGDPDPIEAAMDDYRVLVAAGRMPPLDGGGA